MQNIFPLIGAGFGLLVSIKTLISKSDLEQVFLTPEQIVKMKFYRTVGFSASFGVLIADAYFIWCLILEGQTYRTVDWNIVFALALFSFILCLMFISIFQPLYLWIFSRYHYKYKIYIEGIGDIYILKMMNQDVCICSKDPNADFKQGDSDSFLLKLDDLMKKPLIKLRIQRPQSYIQKLIKYNAPNA